MLESKGLPAVIMVDTDWFNDLIVSEAAECRAGMMEGPGRRCAFVRCAQVAIAKGPRAY